MNDQEKFWAGEFGDQYTARNRVDWRSRIPFWSRIVHGTGIRSVYEVGCNAGWNLSAIKAAAHPFAIQVGGCDLNDEAINQAQAAGLAETYCEAAIHDLQEITRRELVFTAGVLIHVAPEPLEATMRAIVEASCDYVLAIEYEAEAEEEVEYRGHAGKLWRRPFGKLYEAMGLKLAGSGPADGFDRCTYWLLRK